MRRIAFGLLAAALIFPAPRLLYGQERGAAALGPLVRGLGVSARVLVIAAHPDDEDTQLITWLARGRQVETAYLSLTRGDGGQNLIGNELGEALGAIRTEELLAARRIDGGKQYFTRAYDFGYSKNAEETFTQWPHDSVLRDVITVVRAFRPHVIVSVFSGTTRDGHGHHQVAGILAREVYDVAGDTVRFPRTATAGLGGWSVSKFYRGTFGDPSSATLRINVGEYDPILGRSYSEIAADSRSQHKSQAFGSLQRKGVRFDMLRREAMRVNAPEDARQERSILDGVDTTWARFRGAVSTRAQRAALDSLPGAFASARQALDLFAPEKVVAPLSRVQRLLVQLCGGQGLDDCVDGSRVDEAGRPVPRNADLLRSYDVAMRRVSQALASATGLAVEATVSREIWPTGSDVPVEIAVYNRGKHPVELVATMLQGQGAESEEPSGRERRLLPDSASRDTTTMRISQPTQPWWLVTPRRGGMFTTRVLGVADNASDGPMSVVARVNAQAFSFSVPITYRFADAIRGELNRPVAAVPTIAVKLDRDVEYASANTPLERQVRVQLRSAAHGVRQARVTLRLPNGMAADSAERGVTLPGAGAVRDVIFNVRGQLPAGRHTIEAVVTSGGESFRAGYTAIDYEHIRAQRLYRSSALAIEAVDIAIPRQLQIAYISGVGDNTPPMLRQLGIDVTILEPSALPSVDLSRFSAVVVGTRAYEAEPALVANNARLLEYAEQGGTLVVQYGQFEMQQPGMMPYPITLARPADRVASESAPVKILDPASPLLSLPNKIDEGDFRGWVQDLTLYMPRTFDPRYTPLLETNDPGEPPNRGALLVAPLGKGTYVYTTLAFFRQLPNGVPGAARLFVNLLSARAGGKPAS